MLSEIRRCAVCQSTKTGLDNREYRSRKTGLITISSSPHWYHKSEGLLCRKCYMRIYTNPKWAPITSLRRIRFAPTGKNYTLKENPRIGVCSRCFRSKARGEIKRTAMHHTSYDPTDVLANTVELCNRCHSQIHPGRYDKQIHPKIGRNQYSKKAHQSL